MSARGAAFPSRFAARVTPYFPGGPGALLRVVGALTPLGLGQRGKRGRSGHVLTYQVSGSVGSIIPVPFWTKESSAPLPGGSGQTLCYSPASWYRTLFSCLPATAPLSPSHPSESCVKADGRGNRENRVGGSGRRNLGGGGAAPPQGGGFGHGTVFVWLFLPLDTTALGMQHRPGLRGQVVTGVCFRFFFPCIFASFCCH